MPRYNVSMTQGAEDDLVGIWSYIATHDDIDAADHVFEHLQATIDDLATHADAGQVPTELERVAVIEFRQVHWKPYRVIYKVTNGEVTVYCVIDGRRDMQTHLESRLLR
jgi:toxin ParE1/3/4